jgi:hypothetical protein
VVAAPAAARGLHALRWGRDEWTREWFEMRLPPLSQTPGAVVLLDSRKNGVSYLVPFFPETTRFLNLNHQLRLFDEEMAEVLARHRGPVLYLRHPSEGSRLQRFGLREAPPCEPVRTGIGKFELCAVEPVS